MENVLVGINITFEKINYDFLRLTIRHILLFLMMGWATFLFAQVPENQCCEFEDYNKLSKDSLVMRVGQIVSDGSIADYDSLSRCNLYHLLDSQKLHNSAICLLDAELGEISENDSAVMLRLNSQKAYYLLHAGKYPEAEFFFRKNLRDCNAVDKGVAAANYGGLATLFFNQSELDSAHKYADKYIQAALLDEDSINIAEAYKLKGNIFYTQAKYGLALESQQKAIPFCDSALLGITYNELGRNFFYLEEHDSAFFYIEKALALSLKLGNTYRYCASLGNNGHLLYAVGDTSKAIQVFDSCESMARRNCFLDLQAWMKKSKSDYYARSHQYAKALVYYRSYFRLNEKLLGQNNDVMFAVERAQSKVANQYHYVAMLEKENEIASLKALRLRYLSLALALLSVLAFLSIYLIRLRASKRTLELKQKLNRVQMSPHFIFNSLNSLQHTILIGDKLASNRFLTMFSKLMRNTLENSFNELISLAQEVENLESYLHLESLRFEGSFKYSIEVAANVEPNHLKVPPMLIQPFVENAIWHGLMNCKQEDKQVWVSFLKSETGLVCEVKDNGVGRTRAKELAHSGNDSSSKKSRGLSICYERIETLRKIYKKPFILTFSDVDPELENPGTRVRIEIPIIV